jgi:site-specific DNA-methyltransferase (adenine-specific)
MIKPYYQDEWVTIYNTDCREILPELSGVDLVVTDPPYGMRKAEWDELLEPHVWLPFVRDISPVVAVFTGVKGMYDYPKPDWIMSWVRIGSTQRNGALCGFNNWEPILLYGKLHLCNDVISIPNYPDIEAGGHPTPKPLKLIKILLSRLPAGSVLDPFMGSGTTLLAAKILGHKSIGIEKRQDYCDIAIKRLQQTVMNFEPVKEKPKQGVLMI